MRLTVEIGTNGKKTSGIRICDICEKKEFKKKPRRWDICASCDMKQRYKEGKNRPPKQVKKDWYYSICKNCGEKFEIKSKYYYKQPYCSNKCYIDAIQKFRCISCGKKIKKSKHSLCEKCNTKRWFKEEGRTYFKNKFRSDIQYRLAIILRGRVKEALKRKLKNSSRRVDKRYENLGKIELLVGCGLDELKNHIESQFKNGMTWENWKHDGWHIDHIKPISKFDLTKKDEVMKACHYSNLQPMWAHDNMSKGNKY